MEIHYNEYRQVGTDYTNTKEIEAYDKKMSQLRDVSTECIRMQNLLSLPVGSKVLDIGCGSGEFAIAMAEAGMYVCAIDISENMLAYAKEKAQKRGVAVDFQKAGYLDFDNSKKYNAVVSSLSLHHLPSFWQAVAIERIYSTLERGALFFLRDVIYSFDTSKREDYINQWLSQAKTDKMREDMKRHISDEFSTFSWVVERFLTVSGFSIVCAEFDEYGFMAEYLCRKEN